MLALALALLACGCGQQPSSSSADDATTPAGCVRAMSRYSREGQVKQYLDCFTGKMRDELVQARDQTSPEAFAELLRKRAEPVRGVAISDITQTDANTARLKVEWVFDDRNETQNFTLNKVGGVWKIADMTGAQFVKPEIPYGKPVFD